MFFSSMDSPEIGEEIIRMLESRATSPAAISLRRGEKIEVYGRPLRNRRELKPERLARLVIKRSNGYAKPAGLLEVQS
jgi:hypothetical protein